MSNSSTVRARFTVVHAVVCTVGCLFLNLTLISSLLFLSIWFSLPFHASWEMILGFFVLAYPALSLAAVFGCLYRYNYCVSRQAAFVYFCGAVSVGVINAVGIGAALGGL